MGFLVDLLRLLFVILYCWLICLFCGLFVDFVMVVLFVVGLVDRLIECLFVMMCLNERF